MAVGIAGLQERSIRLQAGQSADEPSPARFAIREAAPRALSAAAEIWIEFDVELADVALEPAGIFVCLAGGRGEEEIRC